MPRPRPFPVIVAGFTAFLDLYATQPLLPLLTRVFRASTLRRVSLTVTAPTLAVAIAAPLSAEWRIKVCGRKRVIVGIGALRLADIADRTGRDGRLRCRS